MRAHELLYPGEQGSGKLIAMYRIATCLAMMIGIGWPTLAFAGEQEPPQQPSAKERLNQVLDSEGGIQVYKDHRGNVTNTTVLPNGERIIRVQPPLNQGFNVGPPLQLNNQTVPFPPPSQTPVHPPAPEFPQKAR